MDYSMEPSNKRQYIDFFDNYMKLVNYKRMYSTVSLHEELVMRIEAMHSIINDLRIESNKIVWRNDIEKLTELLHILSTSEV